MEEQNQNNYANFQQKAKTENPPSPDNDVYTEQRKTVENKADKSRLYFIATIIVVIVFFGAVLGAGYFLIKKQQKAIEAINDVHITVQNLQKDQAGKTDSDERVYLLGILPLRNPSEMMNRFAGVEKYLNENTGLKFKLRLYPTSGSLGGYSALVRDVTSGKVDFAYLASVTSVQAYGNGPVVPFVCGEKFGSPTYQGDLVVKPDSPYQKIEDLQGKKVSGTSVSSTSGNLMPLAWLKQLGIDPNTYFEGGMMYLGSHDKAAEAVIRGTIDASFINDATVSTYNKDEIQLRSIWRHDPVPEFPFVVNTQQVSDEVLQEVKSAFLRMHEIDIEGIRAVTAEYDKWVSIEWKDMLGIKTAIDEVHGPIFYDLDKWGEDS